MRITAEHYTKSPIELTRIRFADSINKVLIKSCHNSSTNRDHKVLISTLNKGIHTTYPRCLQHQPEKYCYHLKNGVQLRTSESFCGEMLLKGATSQEFHRYLV